MSFFQNSEAPSICQQLPMVRDVDINMYAKCDQNIPCGSRVMDIFTIHGFLFGTFYFAVTIVQIEGSCNFRSELSLALQTLNISHFYIIESASVFPV